jgi:hypothetical protein
MHTHRLRFVSAAFLAFSGIAYADELPEMPVNPPRQCVSLLNQLPAVAARISTANCLASARMDLVSLTSPDLETANELAFAVAPSIALLDNVISLNDPYWTILAEDAKRDTYRSMAMRMRRTVRPDDDLGQIRVDALVANWLSNVDLSTMRVVEIAEKNPELIQRDSVVFAIAKSASEDATQVATRARQR